MLGMNYSMVVDGGRYERCVGCWLSGERDSIIRFGISKIIFI